MQSNGACRLTHANLPSIGKAGQAKISRSCVGIAGLGGVGGMAFQLLLRAGAGRLKIADGGFFEESNANRQSLWSRKTDGMGKIAAAIAFASQHGSKCRIKSFGKITHANSAEFARGCEAVIDATDSKESRMAVLAGCKKSKIPYIFSSARGRRAMLSVFRPGSVQGAAALFSAPASRQSCDHALGPVASSIGCLAAQMALNITLKKPTVDFPRILSIDGFSGELAVVHKF